MKVASLTMESPTYHVVDMFTAGETYTVIVSSSWCFGDSQSYYPPDTLSKLEFNKLLAKHKEPGISWKVFKIRQRNLTNGNLLEAKKILERALVHTDIQSEHETERCSSRQKRHKSKHCASRSMEEQEVETRSIDTGPEEETQRATTVCSQAVEVSTRQAPVVPSGLNVVPISGVKETLPSSRFQSPTTHVELAQNSFNAANGRNLALQGNSEPLEITSDASNSNNGFCIDQRSGRDGVRIDKTAQHQQNIRHGNQHPVNPNQPCNISSLQESNSPYGNGHRITPDVPNLGIAQTTEDRQTANAEMIDPLHNGEKQTADPDRSDIIKILRNQQRQIDLLINGGALHKEIEASHVLADVVPIKTIDKFEEFEQSLESEERRNELVSVIRGTGGGTAKLATERALNVILDNGLAQFLN